uniref:Fibronectin type-III domain-containing protein n=1 Tax=Romanomermis culicivorax TaxID=13658 RepID=A0A915HLH1_ROMCU
MYAENVKGRSAASEATEAFQTLQTVPDSVRNDVEVRPISPTSLRLTWTPLQLHAWNGVAKGYEIDYYKNDSSADAFKKIIFVNDTISGEYEIHGLKPYSFYAVKISAVGEVGKGLASQPIVKRT